MRSAHVLHLVLAIAVLPACLSPAQALDPNNQDQVMFPGEGLRAATPFDTDSVFGSSAPGNMDEFGNQFGNAPRPVAGETHPRSGALQVNTAPGIPGRISD